VCGGMEPPQVGKDMELGVRAGIGQGGYVWNASLHRAVCHTLPTGNLGMPRLGAV
jgi:hypothetical protein